MSGMCVVEMEAVDLSVHRVNDSFEVLPGLKDSFSARISRTSSNIENSSGCWHSPMIEIEGKRESHL